MGKFMRIGAIAVATGASLAIAPGAFAHHCYKTEWEEAAYSQVSSKTPWVPLSDFLAMGLSTFPGGTPECVAHTGEWADEWMDAQGIDVEPLIHTKATAGGGAHDRNGKELPSISYLEDADFDYLIGLAFSNPDCADLEFPAGP